MIQNNYSDTCEEVKFMHINYFHIRASDRKRNTQPLQGSLFKVRFRKEFARDEIASDILIVRGIAVSEAMYISRF